MHIITIIIHFNIIYHSFQYDKCTSLPSSNYNLDTSRYSMANTNFEQGYKSSSNNN